MLDCQYACVCVYLFYHRELLKKRRTGVGSMRSLLSPSDQSKCTLKLRIQVTEDTRTHYCMPCGMCHVAQNPYSSKERAHVLPTYIYACIIAHLHTCIKVYTKYCTIVLIFASHPLHVHPQVLLLLAPPSPTQTMSSAPTVSAGLSNTLLRDTFPSAKSSTVVWRENHNQRLRRALIREYR